MGGALLLLLAQEPLLSFFLDGLVMADDTTCDNADFAVSGHMPNEAADDGTVDAALGHGRFRHRGRSCQDGGEEG